LGTYLEYQMWGAQWGWTMTETHSAVPSSTQATRRWLLATAAGGVVWALGAGAHGLWSWDEEHAQLRRDFDQGSRSCRRYADRGRQQRCADLFRLMYEGDRNTAIFTRVLLALLPPALVIGGVWAWAFLARRR
jgi:hypothetical protein